MYKTSFIMHNEEGLHARPATVFCKTAAQFSSDILISKEGEDGKYNAKNIIGVLSLGVSKGERLFIHAEGDDAKEALMALTHFLRDLKD